MATNVRPIHRLDKTTSGILLFGKHTLAQHSVSQQMTAGQTSKVYIALIEREFPYKKESFSSPLTGSRTLLLKEALVLMEKWGLPVMNA
ncbi:hypothetical protein AZF37_09450 [endosymbiont 'TC1' of Trimyema compressum]|nr:pseudouridine synthase [endosymbiont 'TC1' of Trimyema compressum]AMP21342.1 hypothetical protein AZF37_09450 [endosymbiont 'TC1' of Trimyema compressum]